MNGNRWCSARFEFWSGRIPVACCGGGERIRLCSYLENRDSRPRQGGAAGSFNGGPNGNRTRVSGVRGQRPRPLDDGTVGQAQVKRQSVEWKWNNENMRF